jgi:hypothetical protein
MAPGALGVAESSKGGADRWSAEKPFRVAMCCAKCFRTLDFGTPAVKAARCSGSPMRISRRVTGLRSETRTGAVGPDAVIH